LCTAAIKIIYKSKNNQKWQDSLRNVILFLVVNSIVSTFKTSNFTSKCQGNCKNDVKSGDIYVAFKGTLFEVGCYKEGVKTKIYSVSIKSALHQDQIDFQETEYYK
jgi:hypothetical protein